MDHRDFKVGSSICQWEFLMQRLVSCVLLSLLLVSIPVCAQTSGAEPLRLGMAGLVHGHALGFLSRYLKRADVQLVGVAEPDQAVASRYQQRFGLDPSKLFPSVEQMLDKARPQAVVIFTNTFDHLRAVEACASRSIPAMMEKPLAVSVEHARAIELAARKGNIPVMVNYETTWYASNRAAWNLVKEQKALGDIRKIVVHDGHPGPKALNVPPEFFDWLTDPVRNGAGALFDFGCYGANLITWLMDGKRPVAVTAITQRFQPDVYRGVDDEATILVEYPSAQGIIQASWNWPFDRKDMEVYGRVGQVFALRGDSIRVRLPGKQEEQSKASPIPAPEDDFLNYLAAVVRKEIKPSGLSSLENNVVVTEILDAARRSAATGRRIVLQ
jgi:scyllo-inositol 2-dehydrogenase (NADP+)